MHKVRLPLVALCFCTLLAGCSSNQPAPLNDDSTTEAITITTSSDLQQQIDDLQSQVSELHSQIATTTNTYATVYDLDNSYYENINYYELGNELFSKDDWIEMNKLVDQYNLEVIFNGVEPFFEINQKKYYAPRLREAYESGVPWIIESTNYEDGVTIRMVTINPKGPFLLSLPDLRSAGIIK